MTHVRMKTQVSRRRRLHRAGLLGLAAVLMVPASAGADRPGSVRQSGEKGRSATRRGGTTTTTRSTTRGRVTTPERRAATTRSARAGAARGSRAGYRRGYSRGRYTGRRDAWRSYRRWRAVTGAIKLGVYLATRPKRTQTVVVTGSTYYYSGGVFYVTSGTGYAVTSAPPGAVVYAVPTYTTVVYVGTTPYYYAGGTYYVVSTQPVPAPPPADPNATQAATGGEDLGDVPMIEDDDQTYEVVAPPVGASVPYVPEEAGEVTVAGKKYFVYDGTFYRPYASEDDTVYVVVEDPRAA